MAQVRTLLSAMVGGALVGILLVSLIGPRYIQWDSTAGGVSAMCLCGETARQGADRLISYQMTGCAVGALVGVLAGGVFLVLRRKKLPAATPPAA